MEVLDNVIWDSLTGAQARFAQGERGARRFKAEVSSLAGFASPSAPDWAALAPVCLPGDHVYCMDWTGTAPPGWVIEQEVTAWRMLWAGPAPDLDPAPGVGLLAGAHTGPALELAKLTNPGPFGERTLELGEFLGYFEDTRLVAMAGERMQSGSFREVSAVCTHPDYQGRGLARRLTLEIVRRQLARGQRPFLHVMTVNTRAVGLYRSLGFRPDRELIVRCLQRLT